MESERAEEMGGEFRAHHQHVVDQINIIAQLASPCGRTRSFHDFALARMVIPSRKEQRKRKTRRGLLLINGDDTDRPMSYQLKLMVRYLISSAMHRDLSANARTVRDFGPPTQLNGHRGSSDCSGSTREEHRRKPALEHLWSRRRTAVAPQRSW